MLNSPAIEFANIIKNKVLANNSELTVCYKRNALTNAWGIFQPILA